MSRIYGTDENGKPLLLRLECDQPGCASKLKPGPHVIGSGWVKCGEERGIEWHYCPEHVSLEGGAR